MALDEHIVDAINKYQIYTMHRYGQNHWRSDGSISNGTRGSWRRTGMKLYNRLPRYQNRVEKIP